ncbi:hypothetical protein QOT17_000837 [Balamuthia mandrillaris]
MEQENNWTKLLRSPDVGPSQALDPISNAADLHSVGKRLVHWYAMKSHKERLAVQSEGNGPPFHVQCNPDDGVIAQLLWLPGRRAEHSELKDVPTALVTVPRCSLVTRGWSHTDNQGGIFTQDNSPAVLFRANSIAEKTQRIVLAIVTDLRYHLPQSLAVGTQFELGWRSDLKSLHHRQQLDILLLQSLEVKKDVACSSREPLVNVTPHPMSAEAHEKSIASYGLALGEVLRQFRTPICTLFHRREEALIGVLDPKAHLKPTDIPLRSLDGTPGTETDDVDDSNWATCKLVVDVNGGSAIKIYAIEQEQNTTKAATGDTEREVDEGGNKEGQCER